jgi:hypothetical protein
MFAGKIISLVTSCVLFINPYFLFLGTAQYADVLLAFYLLSGIILLTISIKEKDKNLAGISGALLGLLTFVKNEGVVMSCLILTLVFIYLIFNKTDDKKINRSMFLKMLFGFLIAAIPTIIFQLFLAPSNNDILPNLTLNASALFTKENMIIVFNSLKKELGNREWCSIWFLILFIIITNFKSLIRKEACILSAFFLLYILVLSIVYISTQKVDITWWISSSLPRIYFYLLPSILFLCYYSLLGTKTEKA